MKPRGWTGLSRGRALWDTPELRAAHLAKRDRPLSVRFDKFVVRHDGCWDWTGCHNGLGYGYLRVNKKLRLATHISLELDGRPQPSPDHVVLHECDNPPCTNPSHLRWGTRAENTRDGYSKGRIKTPTERRAAGAPFVGRLS